MLPIEGIKVARILGIGGEGRRFIASCFRGNDAARNFEMVCRVGKLIGEMLTERVARFRTLLPGLVWVLLYGFFNQQLLTSQTIERPDPP